MNSAIESYKDAVWSYLIEHCDITKRGKMFVKFHTNSRQDFEKHVRARWKYGYHRDNPKEKDMERINQRLNHLLKVREEKLQAKERYIKQISRGARKMFWKKVFLYLGFDRLI